MVNQNYKKPCKSAIIKIRLKMIFHATNYEGYG